MAEQNVSFDWAKIQEGLIKAADGYDDLQSTLGYGAGRVASGLRQVAEGIKIAPDSGRGELTYDEMQEITQAAFDCYVFGVFKVGNGLVPYLIDSKNKPFIADLPLPHRYTLATERLQRSLTLFCGKAFTVYNSEGRKVLVYWSQPSDVGYCLSKY